MFYKHQNAESRLSAWRQIRQKEYSTVDELLKEFADITPIPRYIDYYTPNDWPNVFEIVKEGYFCQSGITLIITATLLHKGFISEEDLQFKVISNHITGIDGIVLIHDGYAYNFLPGRRVNIDEVSANSTTFGLHNVPVKQLFS